jgi:hypothetical protein
MLDNHAGTAEKSQHKEIKGRRSAITIQLSISHKFICSFIGLLFHSLLQWILRAYAYTLHHWTGSTYRRELLRTILYPIAYYPILASKVTIKISLVHSNRKHLSVLLANHQLLFTKNMTYGVFPWNQLPFSLVQDMRNSKQSSTGVEFTSQTAD